MSGDVRNLYVVTSRHPVYIRTKPQSWSIGTLYRHQQFYVHGEEGGYYWGYAYGNFKGHGWVSKKALTPQLLSGVIVPIPELPAEPLSSRYLSIFDYGTAHTPADAPKGKLTIHVRLTHNAFLHGNYRRGKASDARDHLIHIIHAGRHNLLGWRYMTKDGRFCMVRHDRLNLWGFVRRDRMTMPVPNKYFDHHKEPEVRGLLPQAGWGR